ncbi:MAG: coiled-coil domain-containing protein, partial [Candidatus Hodarchaeota archaeon]
MSEEEKFESLIQEIKEIYLFLTQQEPTPDDEIEAREKLIKKIESLKTVNSHHVEFYIDLLNVTLSELDKWDTLELWFTESELPEYVRKIISITEEIPEIQAGIEYKEPITTELRKDLEKASLDIDKIVGKVSEQFKGEIDDLKSEIDSLKLELEKKDETLKKVSQMKVVKKITPKKDVKLPPPKIKIPVIRRPEKPPQIKVPGEIETEKPNALIDLKSIEKVQSKIEKEIEKLKAPPILDSLELKTVSELPKKPESILNIL